MAQYMNSNFELAGPLAGLFGGIQQGQQEEASRLQNIYQDLLNQRYGAETPAKAAEAKLNEAIATGKLEGGYAPAAVQAAVGAEKAKVDEQQLKRYENNIDIARNALSLGMPPEQVAAKFGITSGPVFDAFIKDPNGTLDGIWGNIQKRKVQDTKHLQKLEEIEATGEQQRKTAQVRGTAGGGSTSAVDKARYKILTAGPQSVVNYTGAALTTGVDPLTKKPIDETDRVVLQAYYDEAQATLNSKGGSEIQLPGGGKISSNKGGRVPPGKRSGSASAADEAASKGF